VTGEDEEEPRLCAHCGAVIHGAFPLPPELLGLEVEDYESLPIPNPKDG
jgi:hypothetical protein